MNCMRDRRSVVKTPPAMFDQRISELGRLLMDASRWRLSRSTVTDKRRVRHMSLPNSQCSGPTGWIRPRLG